MNPECVQVGWHATRSGQNAPLKSHDRRGWALCFQGDWQNQYFHEQKLSTCHTVTGAIFNILYMDVDTAEKCLGYCERDVCWEWTHSVWCSIITYILALTCEKSTGNIRKSWIPACVARRLHVIPFCGRQKYGRKVDHTVEKRLSSLARDLSLHVTRASGHRLKKNWIRLLCWQFSNVMSKK